MNLKVERQDTGEVLIEAILPKVPAVKEEETVLERFVRQKAHAESGEILEEFYKKASDLKDFALAETKCIYTSEPPMDAIPWPAMLFGMEMDFVILVKPVAVKPKPAPKPKTKAKK